ncbi:MAG TPA: hypothetical protein DC047_19970 [Blastocatellia bacterium]|nr:hypothetical protein [Blastocatellia bacterium]
MAIFNVLPSVGIAFPIGRLRTFMSESSKQKSARCDSRVTYFKSTRSERTNVFDYYPSPLSPSAKDSEYVFVSIAGDGSTQAVRYGPYNPAIVAVYEGKLPKADVVRLVARTQLAIPKLPRLISLTFVPVILNASNFQSSLKVAQHKS